MKSKWNCKQISNLFWIYLVVKQQEKSGQADCDLVSKQYLARRDDLVGGIARVIYFNYPEIVWNYNDGFQIKISAIPNKKFQIILSFSSCPDLIPRYAHALNGYKEIYSTEVSQDDIRLDKFFKNLAFEIEEDKIILTI